jgi:hypothetical protein
MKSNGIGSYLSGYADGEGCFCVSVNRSRRHRIGWEIRPSFSVSQHHDRAEVLHKFKRQFRCGTIRPDRSDKTLKYEVRSVRELVERVIPHFGQYPLISGKRHDYKAFAEVCQLMLRGEHLNISGLRKILQLASHVNVGNKKFPRLSIKL